MQTCDCAEGYCLNQLSVTSDKKNFKKSLHMLIYAHQCSSWLAPMPQLCIRVRKLRVERIMSSIVCPITKFAYANNNFANLCLASIFSEVASAALRLTVTAK